MNTSISTDLEGAKRASRALLDTTDADRSQMLREMADALVEGIPTVLEANRRDLLNLDPTDYRYDRLKLTPERIEGIAEGIRQVAALPSPLVELEHRTLPNGIELRRVAVPFGVVGVIFEARPNVAPDVAALCLKSGNAAVLKAGHEAAESVKAITGILKNVVADFGLPQQAITLLPPTREATAQLLEARGLVDLIIPRGSSVLINFVRDNARIPVIETGAGVCHCYVEATADPRMAADIVCNAKTRRVSVCNALDCLIIDKKALDKLQPITAPLAAKNVPVLADKPAFDALKGHYPDGLLKEAVPEDFGTEFLSLTMAVKTVGNLDEALNHIARYGSGHSESIVTADPVKAARFQNLVDAACVYVNTPTSFTDGGEFGLGAEIGISTQKLHARGPMGLRELTTYKWLLNGNGQTRP